MLRILRARLPLRSAQPQPVLPCLTPDVLQAGLRGRDTIHSTLLLHGLRPRGVRLRGARLHPLAIPLTYALGDLPMQSALLATPGAPGHMHLRITRTPL